MAGANVIAIHLPSGTSYESTTRADGRFQINNVRVGGPYSVTVAYTGGGGGGAFAPETQENIEVFLGVANDLTFAVKEIAVTETVTVTAQSDAVFASNRTGAATAVTRQDMALLPTISNRMESFVRLTPAMGGNMSFAGQDNRMNNITVDGSYFNNSFGLGGQPGDRTNVAPISMDAIEQIQVNVAPFDVRSGNFVGAGVNSVTRSGTNNFRGSGFYQFRDQGLVGKEAKSLTVNPGTFDFTNYGGWAAGPIIKNRLFFFGNAEKEETEQPGTTFRANAGGETVAGSTTRVLASDLDTLSAFLQQRFNYETGPYQDYSHLTPGRRVLAKFDVNINNRNKLSVRYSQLDSDTDVLLSNSTSLGFGNRRSSTIGLNYQASNYQILENRKSFIAELNTVIGSTMSNSLIFGYNNSDESRSTRIGEFFPFVDILNSGIGLHVVRLRAVHAEQRAALQRVPAAEQLQQVRRQAFDHRGLQLRALQLGERVLPRRAERLHLQLVAGFLRRRQSRAPGDAEPFRGPLQQHPRPGEAAPAAAGDLYRRLRRRTSGPSPTSSR